jgi:subtilisin family serine protease
MKRLLFISILIFSNHSFSKQFLLEVKNFEHFTKNEVQKKFIVLGKKYVVLESDFLPQSTNIVKSSENYETYLFSDQNTYIPPVTDFTKQWGLLNLGKNEPITPDRMSPVSSISGIDINAQKAWSLSQGNKNVVIAVVDTGIDLAHIEFTDNLWINHKELNGAPGVDDDGNGMVDDINGYDYTGKEDSIPQDENGHGTHCAGIIGANHSVGKIAGVMNKVSIMALRTLDKKGAGKIDQAIRAFGYAIENGAHIISNSWGSRGHSPILEDLIKEATKRGIIVVAAAGNARFNDNDLNPTYPANYPGVISVSAINARARHSAYSSFGINTVHIGAPGTNVLSSHTLKKGLKYRVMSGTSMAAPHISGIIGLYLSINGTTQRTEVIKNKLIGTATKLDHLKGMNQANGMVDAYKFLQ